MTRYQYDEINAVHVELTSFCNLRCPQCARINSGQLTANLPLSHMPFATVDKVFTELGQRVKYIHICGNYGDLALYPQALEAIDLIHHKTGGFIKAYSNGAAQTEGFWSELGRRLQGDAGQVVFSIDGLKDTNHLYRVGANWEKLTANVKAFIQAGGAAVWEWLPFEHNDHQVEAAVELAKALGFKSFILKRNPRFSPLNNGEHHTLKPSAKYVHQGIKRIEGFEPTLLPIRCKYKARKMIFIDFQGLVLPCCWHGNRFKGKKHNDMHEIIERYGRDGFDVSKHSIKDILQHHWYTTAMDYTIKILPTCRKHCTMGQKMSNNSNRDVHTFVPHPDPEPWE